MSATHEAPPTPPLPSAEPGPREQPGRRQPWGTSPIVWFRPSISKVVWRLWGLACLWVSLGAVILGVLRVMRVDFGNGWLALYGVGLAFVAAGPWQLFVGLQRAVKIERVLSVHAEGVRWQDGAAVAHWAWVDLDDVEIDQRSIALRGGSMRLALPAEMDGVEPRELAAMLMDLRRKALMGLPIRVASIPDRS